MNCENCGGQIRKGDSYCPRCGMELSVSEYKPLQKKYIRGEYHDEEDDIPLDDYGFYLTENEDDHRSYQNHYQNHEDAGYRRGQGYRNGQNRNQDRYGTAESGPGYDYDYEEPESSSGWLLIVLFLIIALMVGFVIGMIIYSSSLISH